LDGRAEGVTAHLDFLCFREHIPPMNQPYAADWQISDFRRHIADQQAYVRRLIVHGAPTQAAEDRLRELEQKLTQLRDALTATGALKLEKHG